MIKPFNTNNFFSGGAGLFIQYHDVIKPVYFNAMIKLLLSKEKYGLPIEQLSKMSILSLTEWYLQRRYQNPIKAIDYSNKLTIDECDKFLLDKLLNEDKSLYDSAPLLNIQHMMRVYKSQHMCCPIYMYTKQHEPNISNPFTGIDVKYVYGDLTSAIKKCDQNFTYILSDIELVKEMAELLKGTCSHILVSDRYRYNKDASDKFKYNLYDLQERNKFVRIGTHDSVSPLELARNTNGMIIGGT